MYDDNFWSFNLSKIALFFSDYQSTVRAGSYSSADGEERRVRVVANQRVWWARENTQSASRTLLKNTLKYNRQTQ